MENVIISAFENGLNVKGEYTQSLRGHYVSFYLINKAGEVLAAKTIIETSYTNALGALSRGLKRLSLIVTQYKLDRIMDDSNLSPVCPSAMIKAFPKTS